MCGCVYLRVWGSVKTREGIGVPVSKDTDSSEIPNMDAGTSVPVVWQEQWVILVIVPSLQALYGLLLLNILVSRVFLGGSEIVAFSLCFIDYKTLC